LHYFYIVFLKVIHLFGYPAACVRKTNDALNHLVTGGEHQLTTID